ncbi:uncharacterized protein BO80DRAFT_146056 [Aspergillus ibericus CBS 121593]|uniref:Uncharacterized protein n=1 Tax=Aspergillus ibericus CBS 121593 TaxID=1448316 RepID=A0A395GVW9_9EURO|nr:hypothetical protein BO80DRAFT_146056 [Aspergillus ibericus CBS 121593]RAK98837.1 hypothetical protein BO80DRAFT_146056 [Aspergillus ibericus CBS 121593]
MIRSWLSDDAYAAYEDAGHFPLTPTILRGNPLFPRTISEITCSNIVTGCTGVGVMCLPGTLTLIWHIRQGMTNSFDRNDLDSVTDVGINTCMVRFEHWKVWAGLYSCRLERGTNLVACRSPFLKASMSLEDGLMRGDIKNELPVKQSSWGSSKEDHSSDAPRGTLLDKASGWNMS